MRADLVSKLCSISALQAPPDSRSDVPFHRSLERERVGTRILTPFNQPLAREQEVEQEDL